LVKIGLIIDEYHLSKKVKDFLEYLKSKAEISLYIEESFILKNFYDVKFEEDLFFVKGRGDLMVNLAKHIENETTIPVINPSKGIWLAMHRFLNTTLLKKAGIIVPNSCLIPISFNPPFPNYIIKNIIDQKNYSFKPKIEKKDGKIQVSDERALIEAETTLEGYNFYFYQEFIKSKWEYKIYGVGDNLYFYKQLPVLENPNKMETRQTIDEIPELRELAFKAMNTLDLKVSSIDFLKSKEGIFYLTDINSTPNFNYMKEGYKIVADFLLEEVRN
jgi:glutathione synthase/RimK-type ligase-like ATP-grasp enzyme